LTLFLILILRLRHTSRAASDFGSNERNQLMPASRFSLGERRGYDPRRKSEVWHGESVRMAQDKDELEEKSGGQISTFDIGLAAR
jgi:hypothetical protein